MTPEEILILIRSGGKALGAVILTLLCAAAVTVAVARAVGLSGPLLSGIYAGALTNTPALAAASQMWNSDLPTVGYSVTYLFGVLGMLIGTMLALKTTAPAGASADMSSPQVPQLDTATVRIEVEGLPDLQTLSERYDHHIIFSRIMRGDRPGHPGVVDLATDSAVPVPGDIVTVIGDVDRIAQFVQDVGHLSSVALTLDRSSLDYRRIAVSNPKVCGIPIGELRLPRRFGATATRIRRGDVDVLATDDLTLQIGDRVRVVAPPSKLKDVARFFGDSEKGAQAFSLTAIALGLALGVLVGLLTFPLPGGGQFVLGMAGGPLIVGLVLGRIGRTGTVLWSLPASAAATLNHLGMMLFLAYAGSNSGSALADAIVTPTGWRVLVVGFVVTSFSAVGYLVVGRSLGGMFGSRLAGVMAGAQTQPAVLAYANLRTNDDPRVNLGYALAYPVAMITKVLIAPLLGRF